MSKKLNLKNMKTFKLICKGILLYSTILGTMLLFCGIDSIMEQGHFMGWLSVVLVLVYLSYKTISAEEFRTLSLDKYFNDEVTDEEI